MDPDEARKLKPAHDGHLTRLGVSVLYDDEIVGKVGTDMRRHIRACSDCRSRMAAIIRLENTIHPKG